MQTVFFLFFFIFLYRKIPQFGKTAYFTPKISKSEYTLLLATLLLFGFGGPTLRRCSVQAKLRTGRVYEKEEG